MRSARALLIVAALLLAAPGGAIDPIEVSAEFPVEQSQQEQAVSNKPAFEQNLVSAMQPVYGVLGLQLDPSTSASSTVQLRSASGPAPPPPPSQGPGPAPPPSSGSSNDDDNSALIIVGVVVGGVALLGLGAWFFFRQPQQTCKLPPELPYRILPQNPPQQYPPQQYPVPSAPPQYDHDGYGQQPHYDGYGQQQPQKIHVFRRVQV